MNSAAMDEFVERVKDHSDIVSVVSAYVPLKKKGGRFWGLCPFHGEKTPSFSVDGDKGFFYCFGCHAGGNAFKFISLVENITYFEAIKRQAERLGIPLPEREKTPEEIKLDERRKKIREVLSLARDYFHNCLTRTKLGEAGLSYWTSRGISLDVIREFSLGFAPDSFDKFHRAFQKRGYSEDILLEAGLVKKRDNNTGIYDRFRNRVMIPIADERGRIVAFGGRVMDDSLPKYLNSPETALFNKRRLLFGLDRAAKAIRQAGRAIIVEGYMDAVSLAAAGIKNVVASLGTSFTVEQCRLLVRYTTEICFCYDSDSAGQKATMRALGILKETGANAHVLVVPDSKDPDEFVRRHGSAAFSALLEKAQPIVDYQIDYLLGQTASFDETGRSEAMKRIVPVLYSLKNDIAASHRYIRQIASRLAIDEDIIEKTVARYRPTAEYYQQYQPAGAYGRKPSRYEKTPAVRQMSASPAKESQKVSALPRGEKPRPIRVEAAIRQAGRVILRQVWQDEGALPYLLAEISLADYPDPLVAGILQEFSRQYDKGSELTEIGLDEVAAAELSAAVMSAVPDEDLAAEFEDCIKVIQRVILKNKYEAHRLKADALETKGDSSGALAELKEASRLKKEMDRLADGKGN